MIMKPESKVTGIKDAWKAITSFQGCLGILNISSNYSQPSAPRQKSLCPNKSSQLN